MQANPTADPWLGSTDVYLTQVKPHQRVRREVEREYRLVREVCEFTFTRVLEELAKASPETAPKIAERLGLDVQKKFDAIADVFLRLAEASGPDGDHMIRSVAEHVAAARGRPERWLPCLDGDALAYWRSVSHLWVRLVEEDVPPPQSEQAHEAQVRFASLQQVLTLLGIQSHDVPPGIQEAIAIAYWRTLASVVPSGYEHLVEDAFALGQHEQSLLEMERDDQVQDWDTFKADLSLGQEG